MLNSLEYIKDVNILSRDGLIDIHLSFNSKI